MVKTQIRLGAIMRFCSGQWPTLTAVVAVVCLVTTADACFGQTAKYHDSYSLQGFSQPSRISRVASPTPGIVESLVAHEGQRVTRGECLIRLDSKVHDAKLKLARIAKDSRGELETADAELSASLTRLERLGELAKRKHATRVELLQAEEAVTVARASMQRAQDRLAQQTADYERLVAEAKQYCIKAPFDGVVVEFNKQVGEYVGPGDATVCTIANLDTLSVEFLVPRSYRHNLQVDQQVDVLFTVAGDNVAGEICYVSPFPNGETNTYTVKVNVVNSDGALTAGERCQLNGMNAHDARSTASEARQFTTRSR